MKKPHGKLRYTLMVGPGGAFADVDIFNDPDDFGNVIGIPGGVPFVPADLRIWPLVNPAAAGDFGLITMFPSSIVFDPVTGNTLALVMRITNDSAGFLVFMVTVDIPMVSAMGAA